jgi:predicted CopG family antitoxin
MGTKTIGLREDVYERLRARKRDGESFTDLVDRLLDESNADWRETFGSLSGTDVDDLEAVVDRSRTTTSQGHAGRQREVTEAFEDLEDQDGNETA